jgi:hypothetical protein
LDLVFNSSSAISSPIIFKSILRQNNNPMSASDREAARIRAEKLLGKVSEVKVAEVKIEQVEKKIAEEDERKLSNAAKEAKQERERRKELGLPGARASPIPTTLPPKEAVENVCRWNEYQVIPAISQVEGLNGEILNTCAKLIDLLCHDYPFVDIPFAKQRLGELEQKANQWIPPEKGSKNDEALKNTCGTLYNEDVHSSGKIISCTVAIMEKLACGYAKRLPENIESEIRCVDRELNEISVRKHTGQT